MGGSQSGRAAADYGDLSDSVAFFRKGQQSAFKALVGYKAFQLADFDVFSFLAQYAGAFALLFPRADAAANAGQAAVVRDVFGSFADIALSQRMNKLGNFIVDGTTLAALRNSAVQAAARFFDGFLQAGKIGAFQRFLFKSQDVFILYHSFSSFAF